MANYQKLLLKMLASTVSELAKRDSPPSSAAKQVQKRRHEQQQREAASRGSIAKRRLVGGVAAVFLLAAAIGHWSEIVRTWTGSASTSDFLISATTRVGLVFGAIWLAWDSLRRPARWLPPGLAVLGVVAIVMIAAQPKLIFALLPLVGVVAVVTSLLRLFRRQ